MPAAVRSSGNAGPSAPAFDLGNLALVYPKSKRERLLRSTAGPYLLDIGVRQLSSWKPIWGARERLLNVHAISIKPTPEGPLGDTEFIRPCSQRKDSSVEFNHVIGASVSVLLLTRRPTNISGFVVAFVIDAVKRKPWGLLANGIQESLKRFHGWMDQNSPPAVITVAGGRWPSASLHHVRPTLVSSGPGKSMSATWHRADRSLKMTEWPTPKRRLGISLAVWIDRRGVSAMAQSIGNWWLFSFKSIVPLNAIQEVW